MNTNTIVIISLILSVTVFLRIRRQRLKNRRTEALSIMRLIFPHLKNTYPVKNILLYDESLHGTFSSCYQHDEILRFLRQSFEHFGWSIEKVKEKERGICFTTSSGTRYYKFELEYCLSEQKFHYSLYCLE